MITVSEALAVVLRACAAGRTEKTPLSEALGRVLAEDVASDVDWLSPGAAFETRLRS